MVGHLCITPSAPIHRCQLSSVKMKETVLKEAWCRSSQHRISSCPVTMTTQKRWCNKDVRSALKTKGIGSVSLYKAVGPLRLTTPQVRPSVSCSTGFEVDEPRDRAGFNTATLNQLDDTSPWQRVTQQNKEEAVKRVHERLQDLRSDHTEFSSPLHLSSYLMFVHQRHENNDLSCATNYSVMAVLWQAG